MNPDPLAVLRISIQHGIGTLETDPNGFAVMAMIPRVMQTLLTPLPDCFSDISGGIAVRYHDHDGSVSLTPQELMRMAGLRLYPYEYFLLFAKHGMRHQWHEDFYHPITGEALQPREPIPTAF